MKTLLILALSLCSGFAANAADAPVGMRPECPPVDLPQPVARIQVGYGFVIGAVASREITLLSDGSSQVVELRVVRDETSGKEIGRENVSVISNYYFEPEVMAKIEAAALLQSGGKLVDVDANKPVYMDGPGYQYYVIRDGKLVKFADNFGGHTSLPADQKLRRAAKYLKADLDNLYKAIAADQASN